MIPHPVALYGCWALALYLLWRDGKDNPDLSKALWLPTLWIIRCGSRGVDYWLGGAEIGRMDPLCILVVMICGFFVLARRPCNWAGIVAHNSWLFFFFGYLALSLLWVSDLENPLIKIFRPVGDLIMALVVATEPQPRKAIIALFRRASYLLIPMSIVLIRYYPQYGCMQSKHWGDDMWCGVTTHKNPLGQLCIISALAFFWMFIEKRRAGVPMKRQYIMWFYIAITLYLLTGGMGSAGQRSSTAIVCLALMLGLYYALGRYKERPWMVTRALIGGAVGVACLAVILQLFGTSLQEVVAAINGKDRTLSERTFLWQDVIRIGMRHPVLGSGYGGFWVESIYNELSPEADNHPKEAHNGYLETFANLGFVGVALLAAMLLQSLRSATRLMEYDFEFGRMRLALLFMVIVMNYSEATFTVGNHLWWFCFLLIAVYARPWVAWPEDEVVVEPHADDEISNPEEAVPA